MANDSESDVSWVEWFCSRHGNEFFCEVDESFISDKFNLTGLQEIVPHFNAAFDTIQDFEVDADGLDERQIGHAAEVLYGLIHARFIMTNRGIDLMAEKLANHDFGSCPRFLCEAQDVLPCGVSDIPGEGIVKLFCPSCNELYTPRSSRYAKLDGAYFGASFPHMFYAVRPELRPPQNIVRYMPRIYGFKLHPTAYKEMASRRDETDKKVRQLSLKKLIPPS
eukprot:m.46872 g.46872  ORF g.46872 m.46872 type:complete len:222 (+) comp12582_c0_seq1:89-754(+)